MIGLSDVIRSCGLSMYITMYIYIYIPIYIWVDDLTEISRFYGCQSWVPLQKWKSFIFRHLQEERTAVYKIGSPFKESSSRYFCIFFEKLLPLIFGWFKSMFWHWNLNQAQVLLLNTVPCAPNSSHAVVWWGQGATWSCCTYFFWWFLRWGTLAGCFGNEHSEGGTPFRDHAF